MPADEYHADPAIGSTGLRWLRISPVEFFGKWSGNPNAIDDRETEALLFGRAVHALVLEGTKALERIFICDPKGEPGIIRYVEEIRGLLKQMKLDTKGLKEELTRRLKAVLPTVRIYDDIVAEAKAQGKTILSPAAWARINMAGAHITANPALSRSFTGGRPEISVFWVRNGISVKARFDYLRAARMKDGPLAIISDLKSFSAPRDIPMERQVSAMCGKHLMQAKLYMEGFRAMQEMLAYRDMIKDARNKAEADWLLNFGTIERVMFGFVAYKSTGAPYSAGRLITEDNSLMRDAQDKIDMLMGVFREHYETFGTDTPWINSADPPYLSEDDIQPWAL